MTSLIRGFDQSFRDLIRGIGPDTIFVAKFSVVSLTSGAKLQELLKRPNITPDDAEAIERGAPSIDLVDITLGGGGPARAAARLLPQPAHASRFIVFGTTERCPFVEPACRRERAGSSRRRRSSTAQTSSCSARPPFAALFPTEDPIGKIVRVGLEEYDGRRRDGEAAEPRRLQHRRRTTSSSSRTRPTRSSSAIRANDVARGQIRGVHDRRRAARGRRRASRRMQRNRKRHAHPPRPAAGPAERLRPGHAGRHPASLGSDQPGRRSWR